MGPLKCGKYILNPADKTLIMGILNLTPDSFYNHCGTSPEQIIGIAKKMEEDGADIIDVGGESTRPGSEPVDVDEELRRVIPAISALRNEINIPISIDTYKSEVAVSALEAGASMVNDISGFRFDENMPLVIAKFGVPVVVMHIKGRPHNMQKNIHYNDLMSDIIQSLKDSLEIGRKANIKNNQFIIDPGIGFGKKTEQNYQIIRELYLLKELGYPLLVGPSRKSFLGNTLDLPVEMRLEGTAAAVTACILNGANIVRAHDVDVIKRVVMVAGAIKGK